MVTRWDPNRETFVQVHGPAALAASTLLMPQAPNDPRMLAKVDAIRAPVSRGGLSVNGLIHRQESAQAQDRPEA
jgi:hypothetical protein